MAREVTLVDAGIGNLASVERALVQVGAGVRVTDDPDKVATSRMVVFPGQSAFGASTRAIIDGAMGAALKMVIERGDPFLGICLGMQLLFDGSDENGGQEGMQVMPGWCRRFSDEMFAEAEPGAIEREAIPAESPPADVAAPQSLAPFQPDEPIEKPTPTRPIADAAMDQPSPPSPFAEAPQPPARAVGADATHPTSAASPLIEVVSPPVLTPPVIQPPEPAPQSQSQSQSGEPLARRLKVPHMGWNSVEPTGEHYYFVHSYYVEPKRAEDVMWMTTYGSIRFPAAVRRGNVLGCQFHPEKSQRAGLRFLRAFLLGGWG